MLKILISSFTGVLLSSAAQAQVQVLPVQAPTLSEYGLGALVVLVVAVAGWAIRRK